MEVSDPDHPAHRWIRADTELLAERLAALVHEAGAQDGDQRLARTRARDLAAAAVDRHRP